MTDLATSYLGLRLEHPVVASAGPLSRMLDGIRRLGAAAEGDKTIVDAYAPAVAALEEAVRAGHPLATAVKSAAHAADDGRDIHFVDADGATELAFEVESFDRAAGELVAWVRIPVLSAEDSLYLEYGGDPVERPAPAEVWAERYLAVWHGGGGDDPSLLVDSTANRNDGRRRT